MFKSSFGKWLAGIAATVIGALIIWFLTGPRGLLNPPSSTPTTPPITVTRQPSPTSPPTLPDLVLTDIILKPKLAQYPDDVIINTVVRNNGADTRQGFIVGCTCTCNGNPMYFSGMRISNGLKSNQEVTLGDDSLLSLSNCSFEAQRQFTCTVDPDKLVDESDESNNTRTETLLTSR